MKKTFNYFYVEQAMDSIDIDNIGNCIIECATDEGEIYYLIISTKLGLTRILEYGPYIDGGFPLYVSEIFQQFDYNDKKITKKITRFLSKKGITQARTLDSLDEIREYIKSPISYLEF